MKLRVRRVIGALMSLIGFAAIILAAAPSVIKEAEQSIVSDVALGELAAEALEQLDVKGRAPKTGYTRSQFGNGWVKVNGCDTRNIILYRDLENPLLEGECTVVSGMLQDSYTGKLIEFQKANGSAVQIDHIVALSNAWQTGAQLLTKQERTKLANDPLELVAVSGAANQEKLDGDAATWLPSNKGFRCEYIARQIAVKQKYRLWVTAPEKEAMQRVLSSCPDQRLRK